MAEAAHALNKAALIASDAGMTDIAQQLSWQHIDTYCRAGRPLTIFEVRYLLEPVLNLARLQLRTGQATTALYPLESMFDAVNRRRGLVDAEQTLQLCEPGRRSAGLPPATPMGLAPTHRRRRPRPRPRRPMGRRRRTRTPPQRHRRPPDGRPPSRDHRAPPTRRPHPSPHAPHRERHNRNLGTRRRRLPPADVPRQRRRADGTGRSRAAHCGSRRAVCRR